MNAAELLIQHAAERRVYESEFEYFEDIAPYLNDYATRYPEATPQIESWFQTLRGSTRKNPTAQFSVQDVVINGCSDLTPIEEQLGIKLPDFFREFYHRIRGGVLALRNPIVLYDVHDMLDFAKVYQQVDVENGFPATPTMVLRFARIPPLPVCFAIRQRTTDGKWRVICLADENPREEILDESLWNEDKQETMGQWMKRLLDTDGSPLAIGRSYPRPLWRHDIRRIMTL